jgi:hypothetical protein
MPETQIKGNNVGDSSITHVDIDLSGSPVLTSMSGSLYLAVSDPSDRLTKIMAFATVETYFDTKYALKSHLHTGVYQPAGTYDNYVSWNAKVDSTGPYPVYKSGSSTNYKGVHFISGSNVYLQYASGSDDFLQITINADSGSSYTHPTYTAVSQSLTGATVLASFASDSIGSVTAFSTRTLTLANLGYTGATNANYYTHPSYTAYTPILTGASVLSTFSTDASGHVTACTARTLTLANLGYTGATNANYFVYSPYAVYVNGTSQFTVDTGGYINFVAGSGISLSAIPASKRIDITCTVSGSLSGGVANKIMIWSSATTATYDTNLYYTAATQTLYSTVGNFSSMITSGRVNANAPANTSAAALYVSRSNDTATYYDFIAFSGTSAADKTKNISTMALASFTYAGMIRVSVAGSTKWIPYYT